MKYTFDTTPQVYVARRPFDIGHKVMTSIRVGKLTPIDIVETLPGDTWKVQCKYQARLSTAFQRPVMDSFFMRIFHFHVPLRLLYTDIENVFGNASPNAYVTLDLDELPHFITPVTIASKTVGDYLHLPTGSPLPKGLSVLPFRAFALVYDQWFRNQNTVNPILVYKDDVHPSEFPNSDSWSPVNYSGQLPNINKFNDIFTSALPAPQKGQSVPISPASAVIPAFSSPVRTSVYENPPVVGAEPMYLRRVDGADIPQQSHVVGFGNAFSAGASPTGRLFETPTYETDYSTDGGLYPSNLIAVSDGFSVGLGAATVNDLRFAFQLQKYLEKDAVGGSRYVEYLMTHYGVSVPDGLLQRAELLGGVTEPLNVQQVVQTSQSSTNQPLGQLGAFSRSIGRSRFSKGIVEHGYLLTVAAIQYKHSYQQGIAELWSRRNREDFYDNLFSNIGEQPLRKSRLYGFGWGSTDIKDVAPFGYNEYAAEYRYFPDVISGEMRSSAANSFDVYHFADNYTSAPSLTQQFTDETSSFFRRATVQDAAADVDDFLVEFYFSGYVYRGMPFHSRPGLIDHH
ncbi:major capsid protein [Dipodfec virus UA23Rod_1392]|uniref:Major capsid protein n=1 Tax=Dipodfec virus UA23Rod_1392 TaxID=2929332 RepID=A0A976N1C9_9VIRU|nr:major capsid protein [Dipodfec virus UA23Rod_1392]